MKKALLVLLLLASSLSYGEEKCPTLHGPYELEVLDHGLNSTVTPVFVASSPESNDKKTVLLVYDKIDLNDMSTHVKSRLTLVQLPHGCFAFINNGWSDYEVRSFRKYSEIQGDKIVDVFSFQVAVSDLTFDNFDLYRFKRAAK